MQDKNQKIYIDATNGGRGDIWMRLVGAFAFSGLKPGLEIHLLVPGFIYQLGVQIFGDRITLHNNNDQNLFNLSYSTLGFRHLAGELVKGKRFISPFQRINIKDKKKKQLKDYVNLAIFNALDNLNLVNVPPFKYSRAYHGFMELVAIRALRDVTYEDFQLQVKKDYPILKDKLNGDIPVSPELSIPEDLKNNIVIFPCGTSKQFIPPLWASIHYPDAYYAVFHLDNVELEIFNNYGMKIIPYYKEPGDIIMLSRQAKWTICTDSFPSHLVQSTHDRCTTLITEVEKSRVINPGYKGKIVDSEVTCHPCVRTGRSAPCSAGYMECNNWNQQVYTDNILRSTSPQD